MESNSKKFSDRIEWRNEQGLPHRLDGPAIDWFDNRKEWYINGKRHREDGPAIEDIYKSWWINGKLHREDGPAIEFSDGDKWYYLNNIKYSEYQFHQELIKLKLNRIKDL